MPSVLPEAQVQREEGKQIEGYTEGELELELIDKRVVIYNINS